MNATHQRKVLLMNSITGELYNVEGVITSIMFALGEWRATVGISFCLCSYINLLETQLRTSLGIIDDILINVILYN